MFNDRSTVTRSIAIRVIVGLKALKFGFAMQLQICKINATAQRRQSIKCFAKSGTR